MGEKVIVNLFGTLPSYLDPSSVGSAQDFVLLSHLVRTPIALDKNAQPEGDLLQSWEIQDKYRTFILTFKRDQKWSDGSPLTPAQFIRSIKRQIRLKSSTHFNFSDIASIVEP